MLKLLKLEEDLKAVSSYTETAAVKVKAEEMYDTDYAYLGLPWESVDEIADACDDQDKRSAIIRLLKSDLISNSPTHVVNKAFNLYCVKELFKRLVLKVPPG